MPLSVETRIDRLAGRDEVAGHSCDPAKDYWYRPGQVLVHADDVDAVEGELRELGAREIGLPDELRYLGERQPAVRRYRVPDNVSVPATVARLRRTAGRRVRISPNHVFGAAPHYSFGPGDVARPTSDTLTLRDPVDDGPIRVAVLDTGIVLDKQANPHLAAHERLVLDRGVDDDALDVHPSDGMLDDTDVHGGFVTDLIRYHAPEAVIRSAAVLLGGIADELEIANGLLRVMAEAKEPQVVNLSLGGHTDGDLEPFVLAEVIRGLDPRPVLVAAAGNTATTRPFYPAAFEDVIGVAATDAGGGCKYGAAGITPAWFTNRGSWVDACADGVDVLSTFVAFDERAPQPGTDAVTDPFPSPQRFTGWARWSGTSFAAPLVAARIAAEAIALHGGAADAFAAAHQAAQQVLAASGLSHPELGRYVA